ncbi:hypothetical protein CISG_00394 [Coccidioides immitis RMSCC 3703]|uniref:Uncharacterized protein n=1 Tax=Coccidioides immitis RMSCC 3703 TaxID=454286 RepID=A0A0J8QI30_COCIT|nr:hypothetical protein CISG_00394 [Coccidioides immitis RMSCC 3703]
MAACTAADYGFFWRTRCRIYAMTSVDEAIWNRTRAVSRYIHDTEGLPVRVYFWRHIPSTRKPIRHVQAPPMMNMVWRRVSIMSAGEFGLTLLCPFYETKEANSCTERKVVGAKRSDEDTSSTVRLSPIFCCKWRQEKKTRKPRI